MRCAACKQLNRKCSPDCVLAPYFPEDRAQQFHDIHHLFGVKNFLNICNSVPDNYREDAVKSMIYHAMVRRIYPVYGCVGVLRVLQTQITHDQRELYDVRCKLDYLRQREQQPQQVRQRSEQMQNVGWFPSYLPPPPPIARDMAESYVPAVMNPDYFEEFIPNSSDNNETI